MKRRSALPSLAGGALLGGLAAVAGVVAWPEMAASGYFLAHGWRLYDQVIQQYTPLLMYIVAGVGSALGFGAGSFRLLVGIFLFAQGLLLGFEVLRGSLSGARTVTYGVALAAVAAWTAYFDAFALYPDCSLAPFALGAVLLLERFERTGRTRPLALAGLALGAGILVKQTFACAAIGAALWLVLASRRRSVRNALTLAGTVAAPYLVFCALWGALFQTSGHLLWTLVIPLTRHAPDMGVGPDRADLLESIAPFLVLASLVLLSPPRLPHSRSSPLVWVALATIGMAWPRWGLLHLSATTGLLGLALARALRAGSLGARRVARSRSRLRRVVFLGAAGGLLATHIVVAAAGGGSELFHQAGSGVRFWDEPDFRQLASEAKERIGPTREFLTYYATHDNIYVLAEAFPPGKLYVNAGPLFFLEVDDLDNRLVETLGRKPGLAVLFRNPTGVELRWARRTRLWHFFARRTRAVSPSKGDAEWREVIPAPGPDPRPFVSGGPKSDSGVGAPGPGPGPDS